MPSRGQSVTVVYEAWDTSANAFKTGDVANHTLRVVKDGTSAAPTNSPSEIDATNLPGRYKLTLTATECTADLVYVGGKSSTANVSILGTAVTFEQLPTAAPGAANGLPYLGTVQGHANFRTLLDLAFGDATWTISTLFNSLDSVLADTNELQTDWTNGGRLDLLIDAIKAQTDKLTFTNVASVDYLKADLRLLVGNATITSTDRFPGLS